MPNETDDLKLHEIVSSEQMHSPDHCVENVKLGKNVALVFLSHAALVPS